METIFHSEMFIFNMFASNDIGAVVIEMIVELLSFGKQDMGIETYRKLKWVKYPF